MASGQPPAPGGLDGNSSQGNPQTQLNRQFELTQEENEVLRELSQEAYFKRSIPLSFGAMLGVATLVKTGVLKGHPKYGAIPKIVGAGACAYFVGKMSYIPVMQSKILERIPNSNLAAQIRKAKNLPEPSSQSPQQQWEAPSNKRVENYQPKEGIDDRFRPSFDNDVKVEAPKEEKESITYDELRKRNREQHSADANKNPQPNYKDSPWMPQRPFPPPGPDSFAEPNKEPTRDSQPRQEPPTRKKRTNIWGDEIE